MKAYVTPLLLAAGLALVACNKPAPQVNSPVPQEDSTLAKVIKQKIGSNVVFGDDNLRMRDGKLLLSKDNTEHGSIASDGTLVIDGKTIELTPEQRALTVKLHQQAQQLGTDAVAMAGDAANMATTAASEGIRLAMGAMMRGDNSQREAEFEKKIEASVRENIKPGAIKLCNAANQMHETKRQLANVVPEYEAYYVDKEPCDVAEMEKEFAKELTSADRPSSTQ